MLFGFCAAVSRRIELCTGVLILPQRQAGVGVGWSQGWAEEMAAWGAIRGITHLCVNTMGSACPLPRITCPRSSGSGGTWGSPERPTRLPVGPLFVFNAADAGVAIGPTPALA